MSLPKILLCDGDGVIWLGHEAIPGVVDALNQIRELGVRIVLVTNNSSKTRAQYLRFMESVGLIGFNEDDVFSSGFAAACYLNSNGLTNIYATGFDGLKEELRSHGITVHTIKTDPEPVPIDAIVCSKSYDLSIDDICRTIYLAKKYHPQLIGTNIDPNFPISTGVLLPGSGAVIAMFEIATGIKANMMGKPGQLMFDMILDYYKVTEDEVIMVGDRIMTDVAFASRRGARSIMVLTGADTMKDVEEAPETDKPTYIFPSLVESVDLFKSMKKLY